MLLIRPGFVRRPLAAGAGLLLAAGALASSGMASGQDGQEEPEFAPYPGEFASRVELIDLSVDGVSEDHMAALRAAFEEGASEPHSYCVSPGETHGEWLSDMLESDCTLMSFFVEEGTAHADLSCRSDSSLDGPVAVAGTSQPDGSDVVAAFDYALPNRNPASIRMRVVTERVGECR